MAIHHDDTFRDAPVLPEFAQKGKHVTQSNVPTQPAEPPPAYMLIGKYAKRIRASIGPNPTDKPEDILVDLAKEDVKLVRQAIQGTQPPQWAVGAQPLIDSLQDEQCAAILAALLVVYVQTV